MRTESTPAFIQEHPTLDRPIFLVGHARGGTTMLGNLIGLHPGVGPKPFHLQATSGARLDQTKDHEQHYRMAWASEQKDIWFDHLPGMEVFATMGNKLIIEEFKPEHETAELFSKLTEGLDERRFFSKAPFNSFRVLALRKLFPNAKIVAIYRDIHDVIGSYLTWRYRPVYAMMSRRHAIDRLARCWYETFRYLENHRESICIETVRYEDFVRQPERLLHQLWSFLELEPVKGLDLSSVQRASPRWRRELDLKSRAYIRLRGLRARWPYSKAGTIRV
ncbi:MAG: sulfotransferase [Planctomycetota bacterium]